MVILVLDGMGMMCFNELKWYFGISQWMFSLMLCELEWDGMIKCIVYVIVFVCVEYDLMLLGE